MGRNDRVALLGVVWFAGWTVVGFEIGKFVGMTGTGCISGFIFALLALAAWPWIMPGFIDRWLYDPSLDEPEPLVSGIGPSHWRVMSGTMFHHSGGVEENTGMHRVVIVAGIWFLFWMIVGSVIGGLTGGTNGGVQNGIYAGIFNGAWWALWTSFTWPWIMPSAIDRWMYR